MPGGRFPLSASNGGITTQLYCCAEAVSMNHRQDKAIERGGGVVAQAAVGGSGLDHRAARGDQPVPALGLAQLSDGPVIAPTPADSRDERQVPFHLRHLDLWV